MSISELLKQPLVFLDTETTGMDPRQDRIIEVGALRVENGEITQSIDTLLKPNLSIPFFITKITGIRDEDVYDSPEFAEIQSKLDAILDGATMIAHNAKFDFSFLKYEYARLGKDFEQDHVCSVKLSRRLFPHFRKHSLDALIDRYNIQCKSRHRAYGDAEAVWKFFKRVSYQQGI